MDAGSGGEDSAMAASCSDGVRNQDETAVDCGGACGPTCEPGDACFNNSDCASGECTGGVCVVVATCDDGVLNGEESDLDCGGSACPSCATGQDCLGGGDCESEVCLGDSTCAAATCGDSIVNDPAETCDDGADTLTCDADCTAVECGDGAWNMAAEVCDGDAGTPGETATCDADCTAVECGDGHVNAVLPEECDGDGAGAGGETAACDVDCTAVSCGDGVANTTAGEDCDGDGAGTGGETAACNDDCTTSVCGDGQHNPTAGEACDDGNTIDTDACSNSCVRSSVGHAVMIGHDYFRRAAAIDAIMGNSVLLTQETGNIEILIYTEFADLTASGEVANVEAAIRAQLSAASRTVTITRVASTSALMSAITATVDVFIVPEQESASDATFAAIASTWNGAVNTFLDRGGVVITCTYTDPSWRVLNGPGLFSTTGPNNVSGSTVSVVRTTDPIAAGLPASYSAASGSAYFGAMTGGVTVVQRGRSEPVVRHLER